MATGKLMTHLNEPRAHKALRRYIKEPVNSFSHMIGILLSLAATVVLVVLSVPDPWRIASFAVYGSTAVLLYTASTLLHTIHASPRVEYILRRFDHAAIFVYIAGCYTPITLVSLRPQHPEWAWSLFGAIWLIALAGVIFKVFWFRAPRWLSTVLYLLMGWLALLAIRPMLDVLGAGAIAWLAAGGVFYTVGAVIYATRWPDLRPGVFGYHELWHFFVLAGSACHFVLMLLHVLPA